jgi:penicillin amidase
MAHSHDFALVQASGKIAVHFEQTLRINMNRIFRFSLTVCLLGIALSLPTFAFSKDCNEDQGSGSMVQINGLNDCASIIRDTNDVAHIKAQNEHDLFFLQGYVHAQDRLFQMDVSRREAEGTLAELIGVAGLPQDVQVRTIGLGRAAERSLPLQSARMQNILQAYADGVNAFALAHPLPPEYGALKLTQFVPWSPVDSLAVAKLLSFGLSFQNDIQPTLDFLSFQAAGAAHGFDGAKLYFDDLDRSAPFAPATTVGDALVRTGSTPSSKHSAMVMSSDFLGEKAVQLAKDYLNATDNLDLFRRFRENRQQGFSNVWAVGRAGSRDGAALIANDPHLSLGTPATWYPIHLESEKFDAIGEGFPGVPFVTLGHNRFVAWGVTDSGLDTTDAFQEAIVPDPNSPSGLSTIFKGNKEPIIPIPEKFFANQSGTIVPIPPGNGVPPAVLAVPRRNNGPLVSFDPKSGVGVSLQWVGFSGTRELEALLAWCEARNLKEFESGNSFFTSPTLNVAASDTRGNIAYFSTGEVPVREDLQAGTVNGLPPFFIRNGTGGNEWLPVSHPQPNQALPFEIIPASEMPHLKNPPAGFFVNSNNDPVGVSLNNNPLGTLRPGGGIFYLTYFFDAGMRAARETELLQQLLSSGKASRQDMIRIQADTQMFDARFFVPFILQAFKDAQSSPLPQLQSLAANPSIQEAVNRLSAWDFSAPTGIPEGYDAFDPPGTLHPRSASEIANSVATTLYTVWRGQLVTQTIDATVAPFALHLPADEQTLTALHQLMVDFPKTGGIGASGLNFFQVPGVTTPNDRLDILILSSLNKTLALLSGPAFSNAFAGSTNLGDYRWGKLHRITFAHLLGGPFSIPTAGGAFQQPLPNLPGIPRNGAFQTVDASAHSIRAADDKSFTFGVGPSKRSVSESKSERVDSVSSLPGGISGVLGNEFYFNLLPGWLANGTYQQFFDDDKIKDHAASTLRLGPQSKD